MNEKSQRKENALLENGGRKCVCLVCVCVWWRRWLGLEQGWGMKLMAPENSGGGDQNGLDGHSFTISIDNKNFSNKLNFN